MWIHLIGASGTGMGALAALFREAGHEVSGSDKAFDPPIGPELERLGVRCLNGYAPGNLDGAAHGKGGGRPDLVVVGNVIRRDNPEAVEAERLDLPRTSMSAALREHFLTSRRPLVVAGTHGKTTTSAMCAWILQFAEREPGWFIGGLPKNLPAAAAVGSTRRSLLRGGTTRAPFVVEGDEYDAVYWHKQPKFLDYAGVGDDDVAIVTSVEQDHIDIYPDVATYEDAFRRFVRMAPAGGLLACDAHDPRARAIVSEEAKCRTAFYALERDDVGDVTPTWHAAMAAPMGDANMFDVFAGGVACGRFWMGVPGEHNVRNALAAIAVCAEGFGVEIRTARQALAVFQGVRRRQDLLGTPNGIHVYDDFAHHPTAVDETLRALRARHPEGTLWAVFEPRSATACRALHQEAYARSFDSADRVLFAPLGRANLPEADRLDVPRLARELGEKAQTMRDADSIVDEIRRGARPGDTVAVLSNGAFGGIHAKLLAALADPAPENTRP